MTVKGESVRTVEPCREQVEQFNPLVNSVLTVLADQALATAQRADDLAAARDWLGLLHGIPPSLNL
jgi:Asp-tRNA(Asn)/Glu-tRNA(Gln) amidotransferase A subunit family amidase